MESLFARWRLSLGIPVDHFHADGIVNVERYKAARVKLCFLMKEPNNLPVDGQGKAFDFCEW